MIKTFITYTLSLLFAFNIIVLTACNDDSSIPTKNLLLVYMGGDNNLSAETNEKLEAIAQGWNAEPGNKLLVYQDMKGVSPQLKEIVNENGRNTEVLIEEYPEENSATGDVLARVIDTTISLYPSSSYGLLLFSHASGWLPKGALGNPGGARSIITDGKNEMELRDFAEAIPDHTFNYILFEACFMAGIEVAYELRNKANYILASSAEIISPGFTPVYAEAINSLFEHNLSRFGQLYFKYIYAQTGYRCSATLSVIKTSELTPLANWIKANSDKTREVIVEDIQRFDRYPYRLFFDFGAYYSCLIDEDKQNELQQLINNCIVWKDATPTFMPNDGGFVINSYSGLSVYIPQAKFITLNEAYKKLEWYKALLL